MEKFLHIHNKTFEKEGVSNYRELWEKAESKGYEGLSVSCFTEFKKAEDEEQKNRFHAIFSTATEDRHGDIVHQDFDLRGFKKNPVFLDSHNYGSIERIIGRVSKISVKENKLQGDIEFALDNPLGALAYKLASSGFLSTTSIGFIPREFNDKDEILKSELLEISAVSVPANPKAVFEKSVEEETEEPAEEAPEAPETPVEEQTAPEAPVTPKRINQRKVAARVVREMREERNRTLKQIMVELQNMEKDKKAARKRKIYRKLRKLMDE